MSKSSKKNVPKKNSSVRPYTVMCTDLYLLWILLVYPLYYADGYFHLPERKATFWCTSTLIYIGVTLLGVIITYVSTRDEWSLERIKKNISMTDIFMFGFLISNLIAFALSSDKANSWSGATGRYYGAKVLILVCISYFLISRYAWLNKVFIWAFLIAGNGVCLLATLDYFWLDVLGINCQMQEADWAGFFSTIGNINTCASIIAMIVACALTYYCVSETVSDKVIAGISIVNCSVAVSSVRSDTAGLGVFSIICILVLLCICGKIKLEPLLEMFMIFSLTFVGYAYVRKTHSDNLAYYTATDTGIPRILWERPQLFLGIFVFCLLLYVLLYILKKKSRVNLTKHRKYIGLGTGVVVLGGVLLFFKKYNFIAIFQNGMGIDVGSAVGTRAYMYNRALGIFMKEPILHKLFGNGQATISQLYNSYFGDELSAAGLSINSSHDHLLDYLLITGVFGLLCYLGIVTSSIIRAIRNKNLNSVSVILLITFLAYFIQGFFNIEQVVTTVVFWLFIALNEAVLKKEEMN